MASDRMAAMDEAGRVAHEELVKLQADMTLEARQGAQVMVDWLKKHFRTAGYERLCRPLVHNNRQ